jgi:hypothetical protein
MLRIKIGRFEKRATTSRCRNWTAPSSNLSVVDGMVLMLQYDAQMMMSDKTEKQKHTMPSEGVFEWL